jgi:diaminopimelate decarboxylase
LDHFNYDADGQLQAEQLPCNSLPTSTALRSMSTRATLERHWHAFDQAAGDIPHLICYAVKANPTWPCSICWHASVRALTSSPAASCPGAGGGR